MSGSVDKIIRAKGAVFVARTRIDGKPKKRTFDKKRDADRWLAAVATDQARGTYVDTSSTITVAAYARQWAATRPHRASTAARIESMISRQIEPTPLGAMRLVAVKPSHVQAWASGQARTLAPSTLRTTVGTLRSIFGAAVLDRMLAANPAAKVALPRAAKDRVVPLSVSDVAAMAAAVEPPFRAAVLAQAGLGLRAGELLGLRPGDVDFMHRTVRIDSQISYLDGSRTEPKTPSSVRTIPLPAMVGEALAAHLAQWPVAADERVFPWSPSTYQRAVRLAHPGASTHDLRHFYASVLLAAGESVVVIAERLGHEDASLVLTTYGHLMQGQDDRTRRAIDRAWAESAPNMPQTGEASG